MDAKRHGMNILILALTLLICIGILAVILLGNHIATTAKNLKKQPMVWGEETTLWTAIIKHPPKIETNVSYQNVLELGEIQVNAKTYAKYKELSFKICIYNSNNEIISQQIYTEKDLASNQEYQFTYNILDSLSPSQLINVYNVTFTVYQYK
ncbi:MAG: hypothetical protein IJY50_03645 [Clostridia bacterium]|nr:hypothetical protein [Clostridia bacterium]